MIRKDFKYGMIAGAAMVIITTMAVSFWPSERFEVDLTTNLPADDSLDISERQIIEQARQQSKIEPAPNLNIPKTTDFGPQTQETRQASSPAPSLETKQPERRQLSQYRVHTVESGETLSSISRKYYGNPNLWRRIVEANRREIPDGVTIRPGMKLRIPAESE